MSYLLDDKLANWLADEATVGEQANWLILSPHPDSPIHWRVESLQPDFFSDFEDLIGKYRALNLNDLDEFDRRCDELGYNHVFEEDPLPLFEATLHLDDAPSFELESSFENTVQGFLPWQIQGFNFLKDQSYGLAIWDTGTGKAILASALIRYRLPDADLGMFVVKRHNKINAQRKMKRIAKLDSILITGPKKWRVRAYEHAKSMLLAGEKPVLILNYEKFRDDWVKTLYLMDEGQDEVWRELHELTVEEEDEDTGELIERPMKKKEAEAEAKKTRLVPNEWGELFFRDRKLVICWDEMPMKLKTRTTGLYHAVCTCLYDTQPPQVRADRMIPAETWQYMFSATPVEHDPEDVYNCVRLMDHGETFGTVKTFRDEFVQSYSFFNPHQPEKWKNLDLMHLRLSHCMHIVSKKDPEIAALFPKMIEEPVYVEFHPDERLIYDSITDEVERLLEEEWEGDEDEETPSANPLALMTVLQMYCDAPTLLNDSAKKRETWEAMLVEYSDDELDELPDPVGSELARMLVAELGEFSNDKHEKPKELQYLLTEKHPGEKTLLFTIYRLMLPIISAWLDEWGISYVVFEGTDKQRQEAIDTFMEDPDILVFLSTDAGSDSVDLEVATVSIDYDFPWLHSRLIQRRNRGHRVTSTNEALYCYMLVMVNSVEDRRIEVIADKLGYQEGIFHGVPDEDIKQMRLDHGDFSYILTGHAMGR